MRKIILLTCIFTMLLGSVCFATIPLSEMTFNGFGLGATKQDVYKAIGLPSYSWTISNPRDNEKKVYENYFIDGAPSPNSMSNNELKQYTVSGTKWGFCYQNNVLVSIVVTCKSSKPLLTKAGIGIGSNETDLNVYGSADEVKTKFIAYGDTLYIYKATENPSIRFMFWCTNGKITGIDLKFA